MDRFFQDHSAVLLGSFFLAFVEIIPLTQLENKSKRDDECTENTIALSAPFAKLHLQELSLKVSNLEKIAEHSSSLGIQWHKKDNNHDHQNYGNQIWSGFLFTRQENNDKNIHDKKEPQQQSTDPPILYLPSEDPLRLHPIPCRAVGYVQRQGPLYPTSETTSYVIVSEGTLVRILPPIQQTNPSYYYACITRQHALLQLLGEMQTSPITKEMEEELIHNHNPETIRELTLRMSLQLAEPLHIGTTGDAFSLKHKHQRQRQAMAKSLQNYCAKQLPKTQRQSPSRISPPNNTPLQGRQQQLPTIMRDGALLVHSPNHGSGKTELVKMIAQRRLQCNAVHVVQPGPLLAKYGSHADTALECMLHAITMSAAAKGTDCGSICIILDHLDAMMPPKLSGKLATGDAAAPVLNAVASYLKMLILSLKKHREFLFPSKNPLYNLGGRSGQVLSLKVCLVAIVTCPDDGWRSVQARSTGNDVMGHTTCILDALPYGRYRLPALSAATRLKAFYWAFQQENVVLTEDAQRRLPLLAASAVWCRGNMFRAVARRLRRCSDEQILPTAAQRVTSKDIEVALVSIGKGTSVTSKISFLAQTEGNSSGEDPFGVVGGNSDAKQSLQDALALDVTKRSVLRSMGLGTPIGVLLYGPPGCGKTLMAKAVARLLRAPGASASHIGGAFVALNSSDIVQAEIGSSEKLIVAAFQTARENAPSVIFIGTTCYLTLCIVIMSVGISPPGASRLMLRACIAPDEFQALFTERSRSGSGKLSSTLLQCMDDIKLWRDSSRKATSESERTKQQSDELCDMSLKENVVVLAATNTPWMVDKAFLRPGRFDRLVHVGLPSREDRGSILKVHASKMKIKDEQNVAGLCERIAEKTKGFSGADLSALCRAAAVRCLIEGSDSIEERHFLLELTESFTASSNLDLVERNMGWRP